MVDGKAGSGAKMQLGKSNFSAGKWREKNESGVGG